MIVVVPSTPAQYFHCLRRQIHRYGKGNFCCFQKNTEDLWCNADMTTLCFLILPHILLLLTLVYWRIHLQNFFTLISVFFLFYFSRRLILYRSIAFSFFSFHYHLFTSTLLPYFLLTHFHDNARRPFTKPLVVMSAKWLLHHKVRLISTLCFCWSLLIYIEIHLHSFLICSLTIHWNECAVCSSFRIFICLLLTSWLSKSIW